MTARRALPCDDAEHRSARSEAVKAAIDATLTKALPYTPWPERSMLAINLRANVLAAIDKAGQ